MYFSDAPDVADRLVLTYGAAIPARWTELPGGDKPVTVRPIDNFFTRHGRGWVEWGRMSGPDSLGGLRAWQVEFPECARGFCKAGADPFTRLWQRRIPDTFRWWPGRLIVDADRLQFEDLPDLPDEPPHVPDEYILARERAFWDAEGRHGRDIARVRRDLAGDPQLRERLLDDRYAAALVRYMSVGRVFHRQSGAEVIFTDIDDRGGLLSELRGIGEGYPYLIYNLPWERPEEEVDAVYPRICEIMELAGYIRR